MSDRLEFQVTFWGFYHEKDTEGEDVYNIQAFGRTEDDKSVYVKITGFTPFFYVKCSNSWNERCCEKFIESLKEKVYRRYATSTNDEVDYSEALIGYNLVNKHDFHNFCKERLRKFVMLIFKSYTGMNTFSRAFNSRVKCNTVSDSPKLYQRYESNIEPHIRFLHMNELSSCGWLSIDQQSLENVSELSSCDISCVVNWRDVKPSDNDNRMAQLKILGYDIECNSCDHNFPQACRPDDAIIQIGLTVYKYGGLTPTYQCLISLKKCAAIPGVKVLNCKTERTLILTFAKKVREICPDIMVGYNNFGFDDKYIYERINFIDNEEAKKRGIPVEKLPKRLLDEFLLELGKVNNRYLIEKEGLKSSLTIFDVKKLSSSALGDNIFEFFNIPGIVSIDMLKVIQRDHKLVSYRLDSVAANFITEKVINVDVLEQINDEVILIIHSSSTKALDIGSYIQLMVDDSFAPSPMIEHGKYEVLDITDIKTGETTCKGIKVSMPSTHYEELKRIQSNKLLKLFWTFAKDDMHHTTLHKFYQEGVPRNLAQIGKYCIKDCQLVALLLAKLEIIVNSVGMAKVCHVPLSYLFLRGQGVKIYSLVSKECRLKNYLIPVIYRPRDENPDDVSYEGAHVITPRPDIYISPIVVLDYSSLYPKSMCERNLSPECFVNDPMYDNLPGYRYHDIWITVKDAKGNVCYNDDGTVTQQHYRFAQKMIKDNEGNEIPQYGILPAILTKLLSARSAVNELLGKEKDQFLKLIWNSLQLAYKITANSLYGQTGARTSPIFFLPIAASTTCIGRERLCFARKIVEENFKGSEIVYGDSVTGDTPIILMNPSNGEISITPIDSLANEWKPYMGEKEQCDQVMYHVWTHNGWASIKRVIRHKTHKRIYRVRTSHGVVDVTEDHSLIANDLTLIKTSMCKEGQKLLHHYPSNLSGNCILPEINEITLSDVINCPKEIQYKFLQNYLGDNFSEYTSKSKLESAILYFLLRNLGFDVKLQTDTNDSDCIMFLIESNVFGKKDKKIKSIEQIRSKTNEYVYDLETEADTFLAGVGEIIVKNTDSIFINFHLKDADGNDASDKAALSTSIELAQQAAKLINSRLPKPQGIVYEKTYHPFILITRKKYVGIMYLSDPIKGFLKSMGIVLKRRDNAPIVKIIVGHLINCILNDRNIPKALQETRTILTDLMQGKYSLDKFIISKNLKASYKNPNGVAHKVLADRMAARDPGNKPQVGDRIPFVYIVKKEPRKGQKRMLGNYIEHPDYVKEHNIQIDYLYYLEHQIKTPVYQILELIMPQKKVDKLFYKYSSMEVGKRVGRRDIRQLLAIEEKKNSNNIESKKVVENKKKAINTVSVTYTKGNIDQWLRGNNK